MLNCKRFRVCLYRLVLLKSILEAKIHKDKMKMLFAFEQLIINTEDPDGTYYEEGNEEDNDYKEYEEKRQKLLKDIEEEEDPYMKEQLMQLYDPTMGQNQNGMLEAEAYFENAEDIINEEEYEESICVDHRDVKGKSTMGQEDDDLLVLKELQVDGNRKQEEPV